MRISTLISRCGYLTSILAGGIATAAMAECPEHTTYQMQYSPEHEVFDVCIYEESTDKGVLRKLVVRSISTGETKFEFLTPDSPHAVFTHYPFSRNIITIWGAGSSAPIRVFRETDGEFEMIFEAGTKLEPDFVSSSEGELAIILSYTEFTSEGPKGTFSHVFDWCGGAYVKVGTTEWDNRLELLSSFRKASACSR